MIRHIALFVFAASSVASTAVSTVAHAAHAADSAGIIAQFPAGIICTTSTPGVFGGAGNSVRITGLNLPEGQLGWDGDGSTRDRTLANRIVLLDFNNGCDNDYEFTFKPDDLIALAQGRSKEIVGLLEYFNADSYAGGDVTGTEDAVRIPSLVVTCKLFSEKI